MPEVHGEVLLQLLRLEGQQILYGTEPKACAQQR